MAEDRARVVLTCSHSTVHMRGLAGVAETAKKIDMLIFRQISVHLGQERPMSSQGYDFCENCHSTGRPDRMAHLKWRETRQQLMLWPDLAGA